MFGFMRSPCSDIDLYGYLVQAIGGMYNQGGQFGRLPHEQIIYIVDLMLVDKGKKIDIRQQRLIKFAAELAAQHLGLDGENNIKNYVKHFGLMMKRGWDFRDPSVEKFREEIANFGCVFDF